MSAYPGNPPDERFELSDKSEHILIACEDMGLPQALVDKVEEIFVQWESENVFLSCLWCQTRKAVPIGSSEANGVLNVFCDGSCEDKYAARF